MNTTTKQTGASQTLSLLQQLGVTDIFGYPGGAIMPMYDAIYQSDIKHYLCRHEQGAAFAAVGYARASGKVGVCLATSGPGATNLITGLADAMADSVPIVAITGQVPTRAMGSDGFQEVDIISLSLACTKHSFQVKNLNDLPKFLQQAFEIASSGRPGPVLIDIPKDIQKAAVENSLELVPELIIQRSNYLATNPSDDQSLTDLASKEEQFKQAAELISHACQPLFYIGGGVGMANAVEDLRRLMKQTNIPSVTTMKGLGSVSLNEKHYLGMLGMHGSEAANLAIQQCDLMIVLGARFDDRATGKLDEFAPNAKVIHMDIDPAEINKLRQATLVLLGDLKSTLPQLASQLSNSSHKSGTTDLTDWLTKCRTLIEAERPYDESVAKGIFAPSLLAEVSQKLNQTGLQNDIETHVTTDVGQHQMWAAQHMRFSQPNHFISSSGLGTMGFGIPAAIGAQICHPQAQILSISGDGSFMMNVQELGTIKRYQLPIKMLLIDNSRLGLVRQWQQLFFEERYSETDLSDNPDFVALAAAFDIPGETITDKTQISAAIERMLSHQGAYLLHVKIDAFENVWPLVPPDTANDKMMTKVSS